MHCGTAVEAIEDGICTVVLLMLGYYTEGRLLGRDAALTHSTRQTGCLRLFTRGCMCPIAFHDGIAL
jgi:hypothetical protein